MADSETPTPPDSLPQYLAEGLPKQDLETLRDVQEYVEALLEYREQPVEKDELPDAADPVESGSKGKGTLVKEKVRCGDESCRCMQGGEKHGPYLYRYYREGGELKSEYVGKP